MRFSFDNKFVYLHDMVTASKSDIHTLTILSERIKKDGYLFMSSEVISGIEVPIIKATPLGIVFIKNGGYQSWFLLGLFQRIVTIIKPNSKAIIIGTIGSILAWYILHLFGYA